MKRPTLRTKLAARWLRRQLPRLEARLLDSEANLFDLEHRNQLAGQRNEQVLDERRRVTKMRNRVESARRALHLFDETSS